MLLLLSMRYYITIKKGVQKGKMQFSRAEMQFSLAVLQFLRAEMQK